MRISFDRALDVVTTSNPQMASDVQTCIDLLDMYAANASNRASMIDFLHGAVIKEAEDVLATHYVEWSAQIEAEKQNEAMI